MIRQYFVQTDDPLWVQADESGHFNLTNVLKPSAMSRVRDEAKMGCLKLRQPKHMAYRRVQ